ncbi:MAG: deoxynucleoside kinase [Gemmatimonadota bacterium]
MPGVQYIAIEGVIGVGKTSLVHRLQSEWGGHRVLELVEENPFLVGGFYQDMERHAFNTEMFFLLARFHQQRGLAAALTAPDELMLSDYVFEKNRLFAELTLAGDDFAIWRRLFDTLAPEVPQPDLVVYLRASTDVLLDRIRTRGRPFERDITRDYIARLGDAYDRYFTRPAAGRLLTIDVSQLDFVGSEADFVAVRARIGHAVDAARAGQRELEFPLEAAG